MMYDVCVMMYFICFFSKAENKKFIGLFLFSRADSRPTVIVSVLVSSLGLKISFVSKLAYHDFSSHKFDYVNIDGANLINFFF